jgi:hypothetical protein
MSSELPTQEQILKDDGPLVPDWELAIIQERMERYRTEGATWPTLEEFEKEFEALTKELEKEEFTQDEIIDDDLPVPDWHLAILEERMRHYQPEDKTEWRTWEEVRRELLQEILEEMKRRKN